MFHTKLVKMHGHLNIKFIYIVSETWFCLRLQMVRTDGIIIYVAR